MHTESELQILYAIFYKNIQIDKQTNIQADSLTHGKRVFPVAKSQMLNFSFWHFPLNISFWILNLYIHGFLTGRLFLVSLKICIMLDRSSFPQLQIVKLLWGKMAAILFSKSKWKILIKYSSSQPVHNAHTFNPWLQINVPCADLCPLLTESF